MIYHAVCNTDLVPGAFDSLNVTLDCDVQAVSNKFQSNIYRGLSTDHVFCRTPSLLVLVPSLDVGRCTFLGRPVASSHRFLYCLRLYLRTWQRFWPVVSFPPASLERPVPGDAASSS